MRLLHCKKGVENGSLNISLKEYDTNIPKYAILSHRWRDNEVTFHDMTHNIPLAKQKKGFAKLEGCCARSLEDGLEYVWIDTCCIDKSSSAELSEAINSMFRWYANSDKCYAYLDDVSAYEDIKPRKSSFRMSSWFTRGWTLQELIAPENVIFFAKDYIEIGSKAELAEILSDISGVRKSVLLNRDLLPRISAAEKMCW